MSVVILAYPPGAGGNHFKNIMTTDRGFANSDELNPEVYQPGRSEVQSVPGRNINPVKVARAVASTKPYILHGHFGELAAHADTIRSIADKKFLVITVDDASDRVLLRNRQMRLGQQGHPWYLDEEQPFLYRVEMYQRYFDAGEIHTISVSQAWHPRLENHDMVSRLEQLTPGRIDRVMSQRFHDVWWDNNFRFDFCSYERELYGQAHNHA